MDPALVHSEARSILDNSEYYAELIETTSKAIFRAARRFGAGLDMPDDQLDQAWNDLLPGERICFRAQARAALAASELLKRVEELEQRIADAVSQLVFPGGREPRHLSGEPDPISIKP